MRRTARMLVLLPALMAAACLQSTTDDELLALEDQADREACDADVDELRLPPPPGDPLPLGYTATLDPPDPIRALHLLAPDACLPPPPPSHECLREDSPAVEYVSTDPEVCCELSVLCSDGWIPVEAACGCGCARALPSASYDLVAKG